MPSFQKITEFPTKRILIGGTGVGVGLRVGEAGGIGVAVGIKVAVDSGVEVDALSAVVSVDGIVLGIDSDDVQATNSIRSNVIKTIRLKCCFIFLLLLFLIPAYHLY
jgi:hypothetical protein